MLKTQLYDQLEYYQQQKSQVEKDLFKIYKILESTKKKRNELLAKKWELFSKIEDITEQLEKEE